MASGPRKDDDRHRQEQRSEHREGDPSLAAAGGDGDRKEEVATLPTPPPPPAPTMASRPRNDDGHYRQESRHEQREGDPSLAAVAASGAVSSSQTAADGDGDQQHEVAAIPTPTPPSAPVQLLDELERQARRPAYSARVLEGLLRSNREEEKVIPTKNPLTLAKRGWHKVTDDAAGGDGDRKEEVATLPIPPPPPAPTMASGPRNDDDHHRHEPPHEQREGDPSLAAVAASGAVTSSQTAADEGDGDQQHEVAAIPTPTLPSAPTAGKGKRPETSSSSTSFSTLMYLGTISDDEERQAVRLLDELERQARRPAYRARVLEGLLCSDREEEKVIPTKNPLTLAKRGWHKVTDEVKEFWGADDEDSHTDDSSINEDESDSSEEPYQTWSWTRNLFHGIDIIPPVRKQGKDECSYFSTVSAVEAHIKASYAVQPRNGHNEFRVSLSTKHLKNLVEDVYRLGKKSGSPKGSERLKICLEMMKTKGIMSEENYNYPCRHNLRKRAHRYRINQYSQLDNDNTRKSEAILHHLERGEVVLTSFLGIQEYRYLPPDQIYRVTAADAPIREQGRRQFHCVAIVDSARDDTDELYFVYLNSYGADWGQGGFGAIYADSLGKTYVFSIDPDA